MMIIRDPSRIADLLGGWTMYVNHVEFEEEADGSRHYEVDLTGKVPGLDRSPWTAQLRKSRGIWYWVQIKPTADPGKVAVGVDAMWREVEIATYEQALPAPNYGVASAHLPATFADADRCDPVVIQAAFVRIFDDLDGTSNASHRRATSPPRKG